MTEPKSTDRSALVGRLRKCADHFQMSALVPGETMSVVSLMAEAAALIESPPTAEIQGLTENISEQLDLLVACAKPASGQNSARVAAGLVRDYIADLIRERDEARVAQSSPPVGEIQGLVERLRYESITGRVAPITASLLLEAAEAITRLSRASGEEMPAGEKERQELIGKCLKKSESDDDFALSKSELRRIAAILSHAF